MTVRLWWSAKKEQAEENFLPALFFLRLSYFTLSCFFDISSDLT